MNLISKMTSLLLLVLLGFASIPTPAHAEKPEYGYLWSLHFDFEKNFDGVLTIRVGPWGNGDLLSVDETSVTVVRCSRVGNVRISGGDAVFGGGYLSCNLHLADIVTANHGLAVQPIDTYGSIVMTTDLASTMPNVAPIFVHPDASYAIDFTQPTAVTTIQKLNNQAGTQQQQFLSVIGTQRQRYTYQYSCVWEGDCHGTLGVYPQSANTPQGGTRISFQTGATSFKIGGDTSTTFHGRMGQLFIDPGNSVH